MEANQMTKGGQAVLLDAACGHASIGFNGAKAGLFTADVDPHADATLTTNTPATFAGSTPVTITWGTPYRNSAGNWEIMSQLITFTTDGVIPEDVYGVNVIDRADPTSLLTYARFDAVKGMNSAGDAKSFVIRLTNAGDGFGASVEVSE